MLRSHGREITLRPYTKQPGSSFTQHPCTLGVGEVRLDPAKNSWTVFDLPVRGTEIRHIALHERDGKVFVVMPVYRTSQMGVLSVRSEAELAALRAKAR